MPCAGKATRLGLNYPKTLIDIKGKKLIEHILEHMLDMNKVIIIEHKDDIKGYLGDSYKGVKLEYVKQKERKGIAHAILLTESSVGGEDMFIILGDIYCKGMIDDIKWNAFPLSDGVIAFRASIKSKISKSFSLEFDHPKSNKIKEAIEKPKNPSTNFIGLGIYRFKSVLFNYIKKTPINPLRGEIEITDTINLMAKKGDIYGVYFIGDYVNINTKEDLEMINDTP